MRRRTIKTIDELRADGFKIWPQLEQEILNWPDKFAAQCGIHQCTICLQTVVCSLKEHMQYDWICEHWDTDVKFAWIYSNGY